MLAMKKPRSTTDIGCCRRGCSATRDSSAGVMRSEPLDDAEARVSEGGQQVIDGAGVVIRLVSLTILEVGRMKDGDAGVEVIQPLLPERFQIEKVADILLDRPGVPDADGQPLFRNPSDLSFEPIRKLRSLPRIGGNAEAGRPRSNLRSKEPHLSERGFFVRAACRLDRNGAEAQRTILGRW